MKHLLLLAASLYATVQSAAVQRNKSTPSLTVTLTQFDDVISGSIANTGDTALKLLTTGNILDDLDIQKLSVSYEGVEVQFRGPYTLDTFEEPQESAFVILEPGQQTSTLIKLAELYDFSKSGNYELIAKGFISLASVSSTTLTGESVFYESNILTLAMNGQLERSTNALDTLLSMPKRDEAHQSCVAQGKTSQDIRNELKWCETYARKAAVSVRERSHEDLFYNFFGTKDNSTAIDLVASAFDKIADSCKAGFSPDSSPLLYCGDVLEDEYGTGAATCKNGIVAYLTETGQSGSVISLCPAYENYPPTLAECWIDTRGSLLVHEFAHATSINVIPPNREETHLSKMTLLPIDQANRNADSYRQYAMGALHNCTLGPSELRDRIARI